jgi:hypothetical protein
LLSGWLLFIIVTSYLCTFNSKAKHVVMTELTDLLMWSPDYGYLALVPVFVFGGYAAGLYAGALIAIQQFGWGVIIKVWVVFVTSTLLRDFVIYDINRSGKPCLCWLIQWLDKRLQKRRFMLKEHVYLYQQLQFLLKKAVKSITTFTYSVVRFENWSRRDYVMRFFASRTWFFPIGVPLVSLAGFQQIPIRKIISPIILGQAVWGVLVFVTGYKCNSVIMNIESTYLRWSVFALSAFVVIVAGYYYTSAERREMMWRYLIRNSAM